jgi:hypothetical protein
MSDGFFSWYRDVWDGGEAARILKTLDRAGLHLTNSATGLVSLMTNGPDSWGEQVFVSQGQLIEAVGALVDGEVNFQLWISDEADVFTRARRLTGPRVVLEFYLDGLTIAEESEAAGALLRTLDTHRNGCVGFVLDRRGRTEEVDWDDWMAGNPVLVPVRPDKIGLRSEFQGRHPELSMVASVKRGNLVVFDRTE